MFDHRDSQSTSPSPPTTAGVRWIALGVALWGLILAVGATGWKIQMFDLRRAVVVIFSFAMFLGFWWLMLRARQARSMGAVPQGPALARAITQDGVGPAAPADRGTGPAVWSRAALLAAGAELVAGGLWIGSAQLWTQQPRSATLLGWAAALTFVGASVAAMVALSEPQSRRGKSIAGWVLVIVGLSFVSLWLRA